MTMFPIQLHNSLSRAKERLSEDGPIGMYVCGPTVYARPHIGNARSVVVYDVLFRLLRHRYGADQVTYVRNITDVDDKINEAAIQRHITIQALTQEVTAQFHNDIAALGCLPPDVEPRATEHITDIIHMIERLLTVGAAYETDGHVLFDVTADPNDHWHYGMLSGRDAEQQEAGARIAVESYKRHPGDFVLWKPADEEDDHSSRFDSPWGIGRPGWHIECSAMSTHYLGHNFDIHGGGADLKFPHHENEIAQSCCANPGSTYARLWVHNGFLTVNGEKMSKSLGNFITVRELLDQGIDGEVIRFALLSTHYAKPLDWTDKLVGDTRKQLDRLTRSAQSVTPADTIPPDFLEALTDDMNVPKAIAHLHGMDSAYLQSSAALLGLLNQECETPIVHAPTAQLVGNIDIEALIEARKTAKAAKNWPEADRIRDELKQQGVTLIDQSDGGTTWEHSP